MKFHRIWAVVLRHLIIFPRSFDRMIDMFYWPVMDVILWGLAGVWLSGSQTQPLGIVHMMLTAIVFWRMIWYASFEVGINLLEECWNRNLTNFLASPLKPSEWMMATTILSVMRLSLTLIVTSVIVFALFNYNIFAIGWSTLPALILLVLFGLSVGSIAASLVLILGVRAQALTWTLGFLFMPITGAFYPTAILPTWLQSVAYCLPSTYVFESLRAQIMTGEGILHYFWYGAVLDSLYLTLTLCFFKLIFERTRSRGFDHLE